MVRIHSLLALTLFVGLSGCVVGDGEGDLRGLYEACEAVSQCVSTADSCITVAWRETPPPGGHGAMCSQYCETHADCPSGGSCWELVGDPVAGTRICYESCTPSVGCADRSRFTCADATMPDPVTGEEIVVDQICLPL